MKRTATVLLLLVFGISVSYSQTSFLDRAATENTGVKGVVTFSPTASLKTTGFDDETRISTGATFKLLSRKMVKDDIGLYTIKVKIIKDKDGGKYKGRIGYIYPASTTITDCTNYTTERVEGKCKPKK